MYALVTSKHCSNINISQHMNMWDIFKSTGVNVIYNKFKNIYSWAAHSLSLSISISPYQLKYFSFKQHASKLLLSWIDIQSTCCTAYMWVCVCACVLCVFACLCMCACVMSITFYSPSCDGYWKGSHACQWWTIIILTGQAGSVSNRYSTQTFDSLCQDLINHS